MDQEQAVSGRIGVADRATLAAPGAPAGLRHTESVPCAALHDLTFAELREVSLQRCNRWHPGGLSEWSLSDWFTATMGELGEAANVAKKLNRIRDGIVGNTSDASEESLREWLADEIADVAIYLDILAASEGIDLAAAIASKFNRTSEKVGFPERLRLAPAQGIEARQGGDGEAGSIGDESPVPKACAQTPSGEPA